MNERRDTNQKHRQRTAPTPQQRSAQHDPARGGGQARTRYAERAQHQTSYTQWVGTRASGTAKAGVARLKGLSRRQWRMVIGAVVVVVLLIAYLSGVARYSSHFFPNTTVDGADVSGMAFDELAAQALDRGASYQTKVKGNGLKLTIASDDISLQCDGETYAQAAAGNVNAWTWPAMVLVSHEYSVGTSVTYDAQQLADIVGEAVDSANGTKTQPTSAKLAWSSSDGAFVITGEKKGTALDKAAVIEAVNSGVQQLLETIKIDKSLRQQPKVSSDDETLVAQHDKANAIVGNTIALAKNGNTVTTLTSSTIAEWVQLGDDGDVNVLEDNVKSWANSFTVEYSSVGGTRTYTRPDGKQYKVKGGTYGWNVDSSKLASEVVDAVQAAQETTLEIPMSQDAVTFDPGHQDWGARYIDVDLKKQNAHFYDENGNLIWSSKIVSGMDTKEHRTPQGVYTINEHMARNQTLKGLDKDGDGKPDYTSKVKYWMPFVDNLVAFHDASWRTAFGGTYYKTNGSHGCINLPSDKAKELYSLVKVGDVVVVHK